MKVSERDYRRLLEAVHQLNACQDLREFRRAAPKILRQLFPGDYFLLNKHRLNASTRSFRFTAREAEVACWLAEGKSNPEIGIILGIAARTVDKHIERILAKMGVENRTAAAVALAGARRDRQKANGDTVKTAVLR